MNIVSSLMPCLFTSHKIFSAGPIILSQLKNLTAFSASSKLLCRHLNQYYWMQPILLSRTKCLGLGQYINRFLVQRKTFGVAQNILRPVKDKALDFDGKIHKFGLGGVRGVEKPWTSKDECLNCLTFPKRCIKQYILHYKASSFFNFY